MILHDFILSPLEKCICLHVQICFPKLQALMDKILGFPRGHVVDTVVVSTVAYGEQILIRTHRIQLNFNYLDSTMKTALEALKPRIFEPGEFTWTLIGNRQSQERETDYNLSTWSSRLPDLQSSPLTLSLRREMPCSPPPVSGASKHGASLTPSSVLCAHFALSFALQDCLSCPREAKSCKTAHPHPPSVPTGNFSLRPPATSSLSSSLYSLWL